MNRNKSHDPLDEVLLADPKHEHIRFQFHQSHVGPRPHITADDTAWTPAVDCYNTSDAVVIELNLAGIDAGAVQVRFGVKAVYITGVRAESTEAETRCYHVMEIERGKFVRTIDLPVAVDCNKAEAKFEKGMLILRLPRVSGSPFAACSSAGSIRDFDES